MLKHKIILDNKKIEDAPKGAKCVHFDYDCDTLKKYFNGNDTKAYYITAKYFHSKNFIHYQRSGYFSDFAITYRELDKLIYKFAILNPWFNPSLNAISRTEANDEKNKNFKLSLDYIDNSEIVKNLDRENITEEEADSIVNELLEDLDEKALSDNEMLEFLKVMDEYYDR